MSTTISIFVRHDLHIYKKKIEKLKISTKESKNISYWKLLNSSKYVGLFVIIIGIGDIFK